MWNYVMSEVSTPGTTHTSSPVKHVFQISIKMFKVNTTTKKPGKAVASQGMTQVHTAACSPEAFIFLTLWKNTEKTCARCKEGENQQEQVTKKASFCKIRLTAA